MIDSLDATQTVEQSHWLVGAIYRMPRPRFPRQLTGIQSGYEYRHAQRLVMQRYVCYVIRRYPHTRTRRAFAWIVLKAIAETELQRALTIDEKTLMASVGRRVFAELEAERARSVTTMECPACHGSGNITVQAYPYGEAIPSAFVDVALCGCCDGVGQIKRAEMDVTA